MYIEACEMSGALRKMCAQATLSHTHTHQEEQICKHLMKSGHLTCTSLIQIAIKV